VERELSEQIGDLPPALLVRPARELCAKFPDLKPAIVEGLLREGESANIIAVSKRGKTFLSLYIGLCLASGRCIFDRHAVRRGPVLYIDAELHPNTLAKRIATVARAMGLTQNEYADTFHVVSLRGNLCDIYGLRALFHQFKPGDYAAVFLDALYRLIPAGVDENSNSDMTPLYNTIDRYADEMGAAFFIIHHSSKGFQSHKGVTDVGSGAGAISRATDSHIILREHELDDVVVMEAACRSFAPSAGSWRCSTRCATCRS
jgi:RecA-family ATPase